MKVLKLDRESSMSVEKAKKRRKEAIVAIALSTGLIVMVLGTVIGFPATAILSTRSFVERFNPVSLDSSLSLLEQASVSGLIVEAGGHYGDCRVGDWPFSLWSDGGACERQATRRVVMEAARSGDVQLAQARLRIFSDYGLPLDDDLRRETEHFTSMDRSEALAFLVQN
jgi:hypothetical protein